MSIVVGYASTTEGRAALVRAGREAVDRRTDVLVVNTTRPTHDGDHGAAAGAGTVAADLEALGETLAGSGLAHRLVPPSPSPEPAEDILAVAVDQGCELIVIGLRQRTPVGKLLLGSNAQRILVEAPCPVLAVKARD